MNVRPNTADADMGAVLPAIMIDDDGIDEDKDAEDDDEEEKEVKEEEADDGNKDMGAAMAPVPSAGRLVIGPDPERPRLSGPPGVPTPTCGMPICPPAAADIAADIAAEAAASCAAAEAAAAAAADAAAAALVLARRVSFSLSRLARIESLPWHPRLQ